jgi:hypothetical protein
LFFAADWRWAGMMKKEQQRERVIYSIGHSTLDLNVFIAIFKELSDQPGR